jgi:uncharacterized membrane protein (UPF0127 family)
MVLVNATRNQVLADRCRFANTVLKRMVGLLNRRSLAAGEGLLLDRCYGIHTFFMRFPIDVLFLDKEYRVIRAVPALPSFRTCVVQHAVYVLELPAGAIARTGTGAGDQVQIQVRRAGATDTANDLKLPAAAKAPA